jgi:hypothetical protein
MSSTEKILDLLRSRLQIIHNIATKTTKYLQIVKDIVLSINPTEYAQINDAVAMLLSSEVTLSKMDITSINHIYDMFVTIDEKLQHIFALYENANYLKLAVHNMSSTYTSDIYRARNNVLHDYEKYLNLTASDDAIIFDIVFSESSSINDPAAALLFVEQQLTPVNKFTIKLLHWIIARATGEIRARAEQLVEIQKDKILGSSRTKLTTGGAQGIMVRYNLVPATESLPIDKAFAAAGLKFNPKMDILQNFAFNITLNTPGIIAIYRQTSSPIEFNLRGLTDIDYITRHDLKTNPVSGLTKKIIEKFNTAKLLEKPRADAEHYEIYGTTNKKWYIFETINGINWRLLSHRGEIIVPAAAISGLLIGLSSRPLKYNNVCAEIILSKCFDAKSEHLLSDYEKRRLNAPASDIIRTKIVDKIMDSMESMKSIKNTKTTLDELRRVDVALVNKTLLDVLIHMTGIHGKGSLEYTLTYIAKIDSIARALVKELERRWADVEIPARLFSELSDSELAKSLNTIARGVVVAAVDELDRAHVWTDYDMTLKEYFLEEKQVII